MEKLKELWHKHPYLFVVGGGLALFLIYYLFLRGGSSSGSSDATAYYNAEAAGAQANAGLQATALQYQAQLGATTAQAGVASQQVSAQQETTDTANNDAVAIAQINAQQAVDLATAQINGALIAGSANQPIQNQFAILQNYLVDPRPWGVGTLQSLLQTASQTTPPQLLTAPTISIPGAANSNTNSTASPATAA